MNTLQAVYYCNYCKKIFKTVEDLFFVEDDSSRSFCSSDCIEKFFNHLIIHYSTLENDVRQNYGLLHEDCLKYAADPVLVEKLLKNPEEVWCSENILKEKVYSLISRFSDKHGMTFHMVVLCFMFKQNPSFILSSTTTASEEVLSRFRIGRRVDGPVAESGDAPTPVEQTDENMSPEIKNLIDEYRSKMMSQLMEKRTENDIPKELFSRYDECCQETLENPDEIYFSESDTDSQVMVYVYIKALEKEGVPFYYFVQCLQLKEPPNEQMASAVFPLLYFPSTDPAIYKLYKKGKPVYGNLKN